MAHPGYGVKFYKWPQLSMVAGFMSAHFIPGENTPNTHILRRW